MEEARGDNFYKYGPVALFEENEKLPAFLLDVTFSLGESRKKPYSFSQACC